MSEVAKFSDTNRIKVLDKLSFAYHMISPDSGLMYAYQTLALANKLHWEHGMALAYSNLGTNYYTKGNNDSALQSYRRSLALFQKLKKMKDIVVYGFFISQ
ncbi:MAG: tetratricopeptide repeat protein [Chitinophagaceae bacterium]|nr:MAG: tetratricopeptide repeat protein [Chitinophagaceae bacterium]